MSQPTQIPPPPNPADQEEMEFSIEEERWNEYELNDGARIKGRAMLTKVMRNPNKPTQYGFKVSNPLWVVFAPSALRGQPNYPVQNPPNPQIAPKYPVHINTSNELWNVYRIIKTGQKLKLKLEIDEVYRLTDQFDQDGMPVYHVPHSIALQVSPLPSNVNQ